MRTALLSIFVLYSFFNAHAQDVYHPDSFADSARVEKMQKAFPVIKALYETYARENHIPGLAYGIVSGGKLIFTGSMGVQEMQAQRPVSSSSVFRIASMTKSFTAMAILKLRDAGKLDLDDPVIKYVPELASTHIQGMTRPITIRNLMTHTAGFPEDNPWADRQLDMTNAELLAFVSKGISMAYIPGESFEYSNLGFALLGRIITKVSGKPFETYITKNILEPLDMHHTYWEYSKVPADALVHGYGLSDEQLKEEELLHGGAFGSTGGLLTSVEDFSKYMILHLSAWPADDRKATGPVSDGTLREMHRQGVITRLRRQRNAKTICPTMTSYNSGLSWSVDCSAKLIIQHSGGLPGFGSHWAFMPGYDIAVVSLTNLTYGGPDRLNGQVLDTLIDIAGLEPRKIQTSDILQKRQQQLMQILPTWHSAAINGVFSESFFMDYAINSLKADAGALFKKIGRVISLGEVIPVNQLRGYFTITGETGKLDVWFTLSPENPALIQEYKISERLD